MFRRHFPASLPLVLLATLQPAYGQSSEVAKILLQAPPIRGTVTVTSVDESSEGVMVQIDGDQTCDPAMALKPSTLGPLSKLTLQVWLLRSDGTASTQSRPPTHVSVGNAGCQNDSMQFWFLPLSPARPVGVVLSVNGTLSVREIEAQ
jgi:hypothetical protein